MVFFIGENKVLRTIGVFNILRAILNEGVGVAPVAKVFYNFRDDEIVSCFTSVGTDESNRLTFNNNSLESISGVAAGIVEVLKRVCILKISCDVECACLCK